MNTRKEHLQWCKDRALEYVEQGDLQAATASMLSDLRKWDGGEMYDPDLMLTLSRTGMMAAMSGNVEGVRSWVEGFN